MDDFTYDVFEPKQRLPDGSSAALTNASMRSYPSRDVGAVATMFDPSLSTSTHSSNGMYHQMDVPSMQAFHGTSLPPPPLNHPSQYTYGHMSQRDTESMGWSSQNTSQPNAYHNDHILHDASQFPATHSHAMYQPGPPLNSTPSSSYSSLPQTSTGPPAPSQTTLDTSSVSGDHKKEKRKSQVRDASRRRRAKRKDEETRLRERIHELTQQIQIMGNPTAITATASGHISQDLVSSSSAADALDEAYKQQLQVVQALQEKNQQYKAKLAQHDQFARLLQSGIQHLSDPHLNAAPMILPAMPSASTSSALTASLPSSMTGFPRRRSLPALLAARSDDWMTKWSHQVMENLLQTVQASSQTTMPPPACTNVAMGWTLELWLKKPEPKHQIGGQQELGDWIEVKSCKELNTPNALDAMAKTTEILTTLTKGRRVFPELKALEVLKHVSNEISIVSRTDSQSRRQSSPAVDVVSVVVQVPASRFVGMASFEATGDGTQPIEMVGWSFGNENDGKSTVQYTWRAKQDNDHVVATTSATQLANETIFTLVRWESEAVSPVFRVLG
ncbi:unnamed protein product [Aphanomyces euteiches]